MKYLIKRNKSDYILFKIHDQLLRDKLWSVLFDNISPHIFNVLEGQMSYKLALLHIKIEKPLTPNTIRL